MLLLYVTGNVTGKPRKVVSGGGGVAWPYNGKDIRTHNYPLRTINPIDCPRIDEAAAVPLVAQ